VTLDVLEFGWFVELEGPPAVLPDLARGLGLDPSRALRDSYSVLARKYVKKRKAKGAPVTPIATRPLVAPA